MIADFHVEAARGALRDPAPDFSHAEDAEALARDGRGVDPPLILPRAGVNVPIGRAQVPCRRHQQHHGGVSDRGRVCVGGVGNRYAPAAGRVQVDGFVACADGADDLELGKRRHLFAGEAAAAVGQNGPDAIARLAYGVHPVRMLFALANGVAGGGQRRYPFRTDAHHGQNTNAHDCSLPVT